MFKLSASIRETGCSNNSCKQINQGESGGAQRKRTVSSIMFASLSLRMHGVWQRVGLEMCCFKIPGQRYFKIPGQRVVWEAMAIPVMPSKASVTQDSEWGTGICTFARLPG